MFDRFLCLFTGPALAVSALVVSADAAILSDLVTDGGFEALTQGDDVAGGDPNVAGLLANQWIAFNTGGAGGVSVEPFAGFGEGPVRSGKNSVGLNFFFAQAGLAQNLGVQAVAGETYELTAFAQHFDVAGNQTNPSQLNLAVFLADTVDSAYSFAGAQFGNLPGDDAFLGSTFTWTPDAADDGKFIQIRVLKTFPNSPRRIAIDDVSFGLVPEPASLALVGVGSLVVFLRKRR